MLVIEQLQLFLMLFLPMSLIVKDILNALHAKLNVIFLIFITFQ